MNESRPFSLYKQATGFSGCKCKTFYDKNQTLNKPKISVKRSVRQFSGEAFPLLSSEASA